MKRVVGVLLLVFALCAQAAELRPKVAKERVIFHTLAGDLVFAFYPSIAPLTVKQFLTLVKNGVYNGTHFFRVEPNFVIQLSNAQDRTIPLTAEQIQLIHKIPAEFQTRYLHHPFTLSMARADKDPDSGETSFSILLVDAPHLDGKYTVFGELERGHDVLAELVRVPRDGQGKPRLRLSVDSAEIIESADALAKRGIAGLRPLPVTKALEQVMGEYPWQQVGSGGILIVMFLAIFSLVFGNRLGERQKKALLILQIAFMVFLFFFLFAPFASNSRWMGLALFIGLISTFRLLSRFESA